MYYVYIIYCYNYILQYVLCINIFFQRLVSNEHYAAPDVTDRRVALNERRDNLSSASTERREKLESSYSYQLFERDCDEAKVWINEKLKIANDANYMDPTNLQGQLCVKVNH